MDDAALAALDVRAKEINEAMKIAAAHALAALAHEPVPDSVAEAYDVSAFKFGPDYIIPRPFDPRLILEIAPAVARPRATRSIAGRPHCRLAADGRCSLPVRERHGRNRVRRVHPVRQARAGLLAGWQDAVVLAVVLVLDRE